MHVHVWRSEEACARVEVTGGVCMCGGQRKRVHVWRSEEACSCVAARGGVCTCGGQRTSLELVFTLYFYFGSGLELRLQELLRKHFTHRALSWTYLPHAV